MTISSIILISFVVSMILVLRIKDMLNRILSAAAVCSFYLVILLVSVLPSTEVSKTSTFFIASITVAGIIFIVIVLFNILFKTFSKK